MSELKRDYFYQVFERVAARIGSNQVLTGHIEAESSTFVRFNHGKIRQPGSVEQNRLSLELIEGSCHSRGIVMLSGDLECDDAATSSMLQSLTEQIPHLPEDPHFLYNTEPTSSEKY